ncbi:gliding motility-associated C-terminal domain-containing protein [Flavobacterium sp. LS2P90]|uniref:Gliding motility-associated C-terminal domain-containing protein n=1 Tax=Flavobacterium xylosi TaxID=3230415 RepID=A0ABW6HZV4_9FLAO
MKNKLLLFLLFFSFLGNKVSARDFERTLNISKIDLEWSLTVNLRDTIKKSNKLLKTAKTTAIIPPPQTTAGSACKEDTDPTVKVSMAASGGSGDVIEWFSSQTSSAKLHVGSIYSPSISQTTTYYVRAHAGIADYSVRVPVVASVYTAPPAVTLKAFPEDASICEGTQIIFTAIDGADLFEFSVDGTVVQGMSTNREFKTTTLTKGQVVRVRTRYAVNFDGNITETAWGKGAMEDNILSASLSPNALNGYINSIKISPTEDKLVFGIAGKIDNNSSSMLLFLDTKPGGFNRSNFGDVADPSMVGFNYFSNDLTPSTFDSYFQADYCLVLSTDGGGINYVADIIELKTGNSTKVNIGNVPTVTPPTVMGVNNGNSGIADYNLGFEVEVLKSLIGYTVGDIKFFALTMQDDIVTNSFLSPELSNPADYGNGVIDYNIKDPNPVVVSADALIPCYKTASISVNLNENPTVATVGIDQSKCTLSSDPLGGNTPTIGTGVWSKSLGPGLVNFSDVNSGTSTATVNVEGTYVFTWTISNGVCPPSTADIEVTFYISPLAPTASSQAECVSSPIQTLTATATAQSGESIVWYDLPTGGNVVPDPSLSALGTITYYAEAKNITTLCPSNTRTAVKLTIYALPTITGTLSICTGATTTLTGSATADATSPWTSASTGVATISISGVVTGVSAGTSLITYKNSNGCTITATVTVNALPIITGTLSVCIGANTTLTGSAMADATIPWTSASTAVATVSSSGVVTGVSAGTSLITYKNSDGCTITATVTVNALPTITGVLIVCVGATTTLTGSATADATTPWTSASTTIATISSSGVLTGVSTGTSLITYKNSNGCTITATVTVNDSPTITGTLSVCVGAITTLTGSATSHATSPWTSASAAVATISSSGIVTGVSAGTSLITYKNSNDCTITTTVTVNALPIITGILSVCLGETTTLTGSAAADATTPWTSASTAVATINSSGVVIGISAGTSLITYKNSNGCTITATITVDALPTITGTLSVCVGAITTLTGSATADATTPWTSGSTAVATVSSSGVVTGVSGGTSLITYKNSNGCTITATVIVNALPIITGTLTVCIGATTTLTGSATADATTPWTSASTAVATVSSSGIVTGVSAGTSLITYKNSDGCTITATVTVDLPTITGTLNVCIGAITTLTGSATADATTPWTSAATGVATVNNSGVVTGVSAGTSLITYKNSNGCTITATVTVDALPTITGTLSVCVGAITTLTGSATADATSPWTSASTGVATISISGVVTGVSAGTSLITYKNSNGCTITATVTVNALPIITGTLSVCIGANTTLTGSAMADATIPWTSASTAVATVSSSGVVTGVSAGTSLITYKNIDGCTITATVTVDLPTITGTLNVCIGAITTLTGSATADATAPWTSASTAVATISSSGVVTGVSAGTSLITYKNSNGCTITATVTVNDLPTITGTLSVCVGTSTTLTGSATADATSPWTSASTGVATVNSSGVVTGVSTGTSLITYKNNNGCTITTTVIVNALPIITGSLNVCIGATTALSGSATADVTTPWTSASTGVAIVDNSGVVTGISAGTSLIKYKNSNGCTITATVTVNALPISTLSSNDGDNTFCSGTSVIFTATGGTNYNFRVNGSSVQNGTSPTYPTTSLTNGQVVDVIVTTAFGCTATSTGITNTVNPLPLTPILVIIKQPTCSVTTGSFTISNYDASYTYAINPSLGVSISGNVVTAPTGKYTVIATLGSCSTSSIQTINPIPPQIQFEINGNCEDKDYVLTATPLSNSYDPNNVDYAWKDSTGATIGINSNILNVSALLSSTSEKELFPLNYTLTITSTSTGCQTIKGITVETITCNIQKGISPDGNGSNDNFDLRLLDVKKLEIFDRYGIKVYSQSNYTDQWKGQSDKGDDLPSATYYYVIEMNGGQAKTGWIYLIREK